MSTTILVPLSGALAPQRRAGAANWLRSWFQRRSEDSGPGIGDVQRVRAMARQLQFSDPGYANDLFAAADRHEREHESLR